MLDISLLFKIAGASIVVVILDNVFKSCDKKELATISNIAGVIIIFLMLISLIGKLFDSVKTMFQL